MYAALAKQPPVYFPTTVGRIDGVASNLPVTVQNGNAADSHVPDHSSIIQFPTSHSGKNSSRPKTIPLSSAYMQLKEEEEKLVVNTSFQEKPSSTLEDKPGSKFEINDQKDANGNDDSGNNSWMKKKKKILPKKHEDFEQNKPSGIDRPRRESKKPKVFDETEFEDYYSKSKKPKKPSSSFDNKNNNDESEERVTPVPLLMTGEDVKNEWTVLEKRAKDVAYKEWEVECLKRNLKHEVDRQHSIHAHRIIQDANSRLKYLYADVEQAVRITPKVGGGIDLNNLMVKFSNTTESMSKHLVDFERALEKIISVESKPVLPPAPKSSEPFLPSLPIRPSTPVGEEAEFVDQLVLFAQESSKAKGNMSHGKAEAGEDDNKNKNNSNGHPPGSMSLPNDPAATPLVRIEPASITRLNVSTTTFGYGNALDMACELHYDFDCQEMVKRMMIRYEAGGHPPGRTLTSYYRDLETGVEPILPTRVQTSVIAYQPSPSSGRVACCVLCGEFIKREEFRAKARARKRVGSPICVIHHYHAQCFALIDATFKGRCIAPRMGIPSMCQSSDKNSARNGETARSRTMQPPSSQSWSSTGETAITTTTTTTTTTVANSQDDEEEEQAEKKQQSSSPNRTMTSSVSQATRVVKLGMYSQAAGLTPENAFRVSKYEEEFETISDGEGDLEASDEKSEGDGVIEIISVEEGDQGSGQTKNSLVDSMSKISEPVPLLVTDKHVFLADSS